MDFEPAEALEIANELRAAAEQAVAMTPSPAMKQPDSDSGNGRDAKRDRKRGAKNHGGGRRRG